MNDNILISFLDYKTKVLGDYSRVFLQMLVNEHKIVVENKKVYTNLVSDFINHYVHTYYFDTEDSHEVMEKMVPDLSDSRVKNSLIIASICVESDKILGSLDKEHSKKEIKKVVEKLIALFDIDLDKIRNKNLFENLSDQIQENYKKEKKFLETLVPDEDDAFYNLYRYNPAVKDTYFIEYRLDLEEFKKWYPANVKKALDDNEISSAMNLISLQTVSTLILKELLKDKKSDSFILKIEQGLLKSNKKFYDLSRMLNNAYLIKSLYLLIDYDNYKTYISKVQQLKNMGYRCLVNVNSHNLKNLDIQGTETIYIDKNTLESNQEKINSLINQGIGVVEKNNMFTFTEREILQKNKEEVR